MTNGQTRMRLGKREIKVLHSLWRWKVMSNSALTCSYFFPTASPARAYNRLLDLKRIGLIEMRCDESLQRSGWVLTKKGFQAIRSELAALREEAFKSSTFAHDFLVTAFHLGDWLYGHPEDVTIVTEQELRSFSNEELPIWVPDSSLHRPDGYIRIENENEKSTIAIEVELHRKSISSYHNAGYFYGSCFGVFRVLWLVPNHSMAKRLTFSPQTVPVAS